MNDTNFLAGIKPSPAGKGAENGISGAMSAWEFNE
jgi:hypothetical protein